MRKKFQKLVLCICCIMLFSSCASNTVDNSEQDSSGNYADIEEQAKKCNLNTVNYLFLDEEKAVDLFFSINVSKLNIVKVDLYMNDVLQKSNVQVNKIYDNVINISITEDVSQFNYIRVYDSEGAYMNFYVGEYYFELYKSKKSDKDTDTESQIRTEDTEQEVKIIIKEKKEILEKYEVRIKNPKKVETYFECDVEKDSECITYTYTLKSQYVGKIQISYEYAVEFVDKQTKEVDTKVIFYLPMSKYEPESI